MTTGYQTIIGGTAVYPSNQTYKALTLSSDTQLSWPIESVSSETIVADLLDVTPINQSGWNLYLPDATGGSNGITMIISNLSGTLNFNVLDSTANLVLNVPAGSVWLLYLTDNSTPSGVWRTFQYGAQAGSVNVAAIAGSGLLAIGSSLNQSMPVSAKGTNYTVVKDDRASVILWTGAVGTLALPAPSGVGNNWFINVANKGTGALTVTPASGLIDGSASKVFAAGTGTAIVFTDGANYYTLGYGGSGAASGFDYTTINCAGSDAATGTITLSGGQLDRISYKLFGILTGNRSITVPGGVQQYWIDNETTSSGGPWTMTIKTAAQVTGVTVSQPGQAIMYCDGTNVQPATSGISLPVTIASGGTGATTAPAARTSLGSTATGDALFTAASAAAALTALGGGTTGVAVFAATTASTALTAMAGGTMTGALTITGVFTANGGLSTAGGITGANVRVISNTVPTAGIYSQSANVLSFASNSAQAGYFDTSQNLNLVNALALTQGGTGAVSKAAAAFTLGDATAAINTLALRNGSGDILARIFNISFAADNLAISSVFYNSGDGYTRHMTKANFAAALGGSITPDALSTALAVPTNPPSYSARAYGRIVNDGSATVKKLANCTVARASSGLYTVTFLINMPDVNYTVVFGTQQIAANPSITAMIASGTTPALNLFQFEVTNTSARCELGGNVDFVVYD